VGRANLCSRVRFAGHGRTAGGLAPFIAWPERCLVNLPDDLPLDQGALLEPLGVALHAIDLAALAPDAEVAVVGSGPVGLLLIGVLSSRQPARLVATDLQSHRADAALRMGAGAAMVVAEDDPSWPEGDRFDVVFDTAGTERSMETALLAARPGGRVVLVGIPADDRSVFSASTARRKELTLVNCRRMLPHDLGRAIDLVDSAVVDLAGLVTHRYPLAETEAAFETLVARTGIKVVVEP
jgi:L-iditol 2-dehydrogenase